MSDIVQPDPDLNATPTIGEALNVGRAHQGPFGGGSTPAEVMRVLEWFVDHPCVMLLHPYVGDPAAPVFVSECVGDSFRFIGYVHVPGVPGEGGLLMYEVDLTPGGERVHLERYQKVPQTSGMSLTPHLRRAYLALVRAGIPALQLEAGLQSGPTFWAYAGVQFQDGSPLLEHLEFVAALLAGASSPPTFTSPKDVLDVYSSDASLTATIKEAYEMSELISALMATPPRVRPGHLTYMRDTLHVPIDDPLPIGKAILFAISPWDGQVDLTDPGTSDADFRAFLGV